VSIEPHPSNFTKLQNNVRLNPSVKVRLSHLALSKTAALLELEDGNPDNSGTVRVYSAGAPSTTDIFTVAAHPLEQVLAHTRLDSLTLLKIDVEGFEFSVLEGLNWEGQYRPQNVLIEFSDYTKRFGGDGRQSMVRFFSERHYTGYTVKGQPLSYDENPTEDNAWFRDSLV
jgi:FkbM family methyltransferase